MLHNFLSSLFLLIFFIPGSEKIEFSLGPNYSSYQLFQDDEDAVGKWFLGGEIRVADIISNIGLKIRGSLLKYDVFSEQGAYTYEYMPLTLCTSFNLLPFLKSNWLYLSMETGFGVYFWKGFYNDEIVVLPTGEKMEERDIGFVGGATFQVRPLKRVGIEFASRYNYIASSDLYKYGFYDKDEKIWENGVGIKIILP